MIVRVAILAAMLLCGVVLPAHAQSPEAEVQSPEAEVVAVVQRLFDGMRSGDSTVVRSVFHPEARLLSVGARGGVPQMQSEGVDAFVRAVGTPREEVWDERIWDVEVRVDDHLATAWMDYAFYVGERFSHCGVNAIQFFRGADGWQVVQIADTRRRDGCQPPPS